MDFLASEYREFQELEKGIDALIDWIEADPAAHFKEVIALWLRAAS
jgi:hypothetical protein